MKILPTFLLSCSLMVASLSAVADSNFFDQTLADAQAGDVQAQFNLSGSIMLVVASSRIIKPPFSYFKRPPTKTK